MLNKKRILYLFDKYCYFQTLKLESCFVNSELLWQLRLFNVTREGQSGGRVKSRDFCKTSWPMGNPTGQRKQDECLFFICLLRSPGLNAWWSHQLQGYLVSSCLTSIWLLNNLNLKYISFCWIWSPEARAGAKLTEECNEYMKRNVNIRTGSVSLGWLCSVLVWRVLSVAVWPVGETSQHWARAAVTRHCYWAGSDYTGGVWDESWGALTRTIKC